MKKQMKRIGSLLLAVVMVLSIAMPSMAATKKKATLTLSPTSVTVDAGSTKTIKATVTGTSKTVKWSTSNKSIATVSSKGVVKGVKAGSCKITAKANGITKTCSVKVQAKTTVSKAMLNAYAKKLKSYGKNYHFALIYFDNNSIPELVVTWNYSMHVSRGELFTYKNGKVVEIEDAGSDFGRLIYVPKKSAVINDSWANGYGSICKFRTYDSKYKSKIVAAFEAGYASRTSTKMVYKYNNSKVSKSTYDSKMKTYNKKYPGKELTPEKMFKINDTNINKMIKNYKSVIMTGTSR